MQGRGKVLQSCGVQGADHVPCGCEVLGGLCGGAAPGWASPASEQTLGGCMSREGAGARGCITDVAKV